MEPGILIDGAVEAEVASAKQVLRLVDKASRSLRTYGATNALVKRFLEQLHEEFTRHLDAYGVLAFTIRRDELWMHGQVVAGHAEGTGDNLAFRLSADGLRELAFHPGLEPDELPDFLSAVWGRDADPVEDEDDDVVTRIWARELPHVTFVTAEEVARAHVEEAVLVPQAGEFFAPPPKSFKELIAKETTPSSAAGVTAGTVPGGGILGYEVTEAELAALGEELAAESAVDGTVFVLEMMKAILSSERSGSLIAKTLGTMPGVFDVLLEEGRWGALVDLVDSLGATAARNDAFEPYHAELVERVLQSLHAPDRLRRIAVGLESSPSGAEGIDALLSRLRPSGVEGLCAALGDAKTPENKALLRDALVRIGPSNPDPLLDALADPRSEHVRELIAIVTAWNQPERAELLAGLASYPDAIARQEAVRAIGKLVPEGDGTPIIAFVADDERRVRLAALTLLTTGRYSAGFAAWRATIEREAFHEWAPGDRRATFHALRVTCGNGAVTWWQGLLEDRGWRGRARREETALMAVEMLTALGTPEAIAALEFGRDHAAGGVKQACVAGLSTVAQRRRPGEGA